MNTSRLFLTVLGFGLLVGGCIKRFERSNVKVTNGKEEQGFPYVVQITMDGRGTCTGSFVSDSLLVTAAHCVDDAQVVSWGKHEVKDRAHIYIHPEWPSPEQSCSKSRDPKFDIAMVRFPDGTYQGEVARMLPRSPKAKDAFTIVGFGNSLIEPFEKFCKLPSRAENGQCQVLRGDRVTSAKYNYSPVFTFDAKPTRSSAGCPIDCSTDVMKAQLEAKGTDYKRFVVENCGGNFRDRSYKETGSGTKRSGTNVISTVEDGVAYFYGALGGVDSGLDSASGAGDSGGPLFVHENGNYYIAATTHGGSLHDQNDDLKKKSMYVDWFAPHNRSWVEEMVKKHQLNFPDIKVSH